MELIGDEVTSATPEWTEAQTSLPAKTIVQLASKLNATKPACFIDRGYRSERYASSMREKLLVTQINVLMGSLGVKGGVFYNRSVKTDKFIVAPKITDAPIPKWYLKNDPSSAFMSDHYYRRTWAKTILSEKPYKQRVAAMPIFR